MPDDHYSHTYYIYLSEDKNTEAIKVNVLTLYKFLRTSIPPPQPAATSQDVTPYTGRTTAPNDEKFKDQKQEIYRELLEIWRLPEEDRKKALKRLYLKWHPDKNLENPDFAEEVFKYLKKQIENLLNGLPMDNPDADEGSVTRHPQSSWGRPDWEHTFFGWDRQAQNHHWSYRAEQNYYYCGGRSFHSGGVHNCFYSFDRTRPDIDEARRWLRQAEVDLEAMNVLLASGRDILSGHVCFMAHEVAEKALKAGMYAACGLAMGDLHRHDLGPLAHNLCFERSTTVTSQLIRLAAKLEQYYLDPRFPNRCISGIPAEKFSPFQAKEAKVTAECIVNIIKKLL